MFDWMDMARFVGGCVLWGLIGAGIWHVLTKD